MKRQTTLFNRIRPALLLRDDLPIQGLFWWLYGHQNGTAPQWLDSGSEPPASPFAAAIGFGGDGWLGQSLVVYPQWHLVAVRMHAVEAGNDDNENSKYGFPAFNRRVLYLLAHRKDRP